MDYLKETQIPLEMCLLSNVRTGVVDRLANHPIRKYFDFGLAVTVNTDDPKMFSTSLAQEYRSLVEECGFTQREIRTLILAGIDASWLRAKDKQALRESFTSDPSWLDRTSHFSQ